jgi:hypothetical protein
MKKIFKWLDSIPSKKVINFFILSVFLMGILDYILERYELSLMARIGILAVPTAIAGILFAKMIDNFKKC